MYDFMILGNLSRGPKHGYLIARIVCDMIGPFKSVSWGTIYPVLKKLEADGLIRVEEAPEGEGRARTVYTITDAGREALHGMLMCTDKHLAHYDRIFAQKVALFPFLSPEERTYLCRHYAVHAQQNIDFMRRERRDLEERIPENLTTQMEGVFMFMDHRTDYWTRELEWVNLLARRLSPKEAG